MSSPKKSSSASQSPPPGSYPESTHVKATHSVVSTSVAVKGEIESILAAVDKSSCSFQNTSCFAIPKDSWAVLEDKLKAVVAEGSTTVSTSELVELQRELSLLRLKANDFKTQEERFAYAEKELLNALTEAQSKFEAASAEGKTAKAELESVSAKLKSDLADAQKVKAEYESAIKSARANADAEQLEKLNADKKRLSSEITGLNNNLQVVSSEKKAIANKIKRFELQVVELTNELNLEKSKNAIIVGGPGQTFADKARALPGKSAKLFNVAYTNLSAVAKARINKVSENPLEDEKNTVFWMKAAFDSTKHAVYRPYKLILGGLYSDMLAMTDKSRKLFDPVILAIRDSLLPTGQPLSEEELNNMLSHVPIADIKLNKHYRSKGYNTLKDLADAGLSPEGVDAKDIPFRESKGKAVLRRSAKEKPSPTVSEQDIDEMDPLIDNGQVKPDDPVSYWIKMRQWFLLQFDRLNTRVRSSLKKNPNRLARYYKLSTGNMLQKWMLVPYNWYIWAFP